VACKARRDFTSRSIPAFVVHLWVPGSAIPHFGAQTYWVSGRANRPACAVQVVLFLSPHEHSQIGRPGSHPWSYLRTRRGGKPAQGRVWSSVRTNKVGEGKKELHGLSRCLCSTFRHDPALRMMITAGLSQPLHLYCFRRRTQLLHTSRMLIGGS